MKNVLIVNGGMSYKQMMLKAGFSVNENPMLTNIQKADLIMFTGGADVSPHIYGQPNVASHCDSGRDEYEMDVFRMAKQEGKPMVGICRGAQFLNVMCGGKLYQDVDNHAIGGTHAAVELETGEIHHVTSTHHQMMIKGEGGVLLMAAERSTRRMSGHYNGSGDPVTQLETGPHVDVEAVQYGNVLCFQPHPEFGGAKSTADIFFKLLNKIL